MEKKKYQFIAIIPARGGSVGVKNKNIKNLNGHPLVAYTIEAAKKSQFIKKIYVSTDSKKIAKISKKYGAEIINRPKYLSGNTIMNDDAVSHVIKVLEKKNEFDFENIVFFQPTSPLRRKDDVDKAIKIFKKEKADSLFTSSDMHVAIWKEKNKKIFPFHHSFKKRKRRQDSDKQYIENGSFYIANKNIFKDKNVRLGGKISTYVMDNLCIFEIDTINDFKTVSLILSTNLVKKKKLIIPK
jgi:CMP-N,N'-diacetyllegionaminic acid synthase